MKWYKCKNIYFLGDLNFNFGNTMKYVGFVKNDETEYRHIFQNKSLSEVPGFSEINIPPRRIKYFLIKLLFSADKKTDPIFPCIQGI